MPTGVASLPLLPAKRQDVDSQQTSKRKKKKNLFLLGTRQIYLERDPLIPPRRLLVFDVVILLFYYSGYFFCFLLSSSFFVCWPNERKKKKKKMIRCQRTTNDARAKKIISCRWPCGLLGEWVWAVPCRGVCALVNPQPKTWSGKQQTNSN